MASIIHEIKRVFEEELKIIESVKCLATEFTRQKTAIEEWLNQKPDLQDIRDVRKNLRSMKSSLRHLLADKEDMDEVSLQNGDHLLKTVGLLCPDTLLWDFSALSALHIRLDSYYILLYGVYIIPKSFKHAVVFCCLGTEAIRF